MKKRRKVIGRLNRKLVEENLLIMLDGGKAEIDAEFGQADVKFSSLSLYERGKKFRQFTNGKIRFEQAAFDDSLKTIYYLFHKIN
jgi:hypothetical protein